MPKQKGAPKTGGRKKGVPNQKSLAIAEILEGCGLNPVKKLVEEILPFLEPEAQAKVLLELTSYLHPKRKAIELSGPSGNDIAVINKFDLGAILLANSNSVDVLVEAEKILSGGKNEKDS